MDGLMLLKVFEICNDDISQIFEVVCYNHTRYIIRKDYNMTEFIVYNGHDKYVNFKDFNDALLFIIKRENI